MCLLDYETLRLLGQPDCLDLTYAVAAAADHTPFRTAFADLTGSTALT